MSYTALYRRLRPKKFSDVFGQRHIIQTLTNQIQSGRIPHAYLFCGTRGTGKTSTARLFARAVNCSCTEEGEPCNTCESCAAIIAQRSLDVVEIDAASNNSVDNVRDLREEVKYPPELGKYKVYIVDEVHMLSGGAFNALLKTLEEPPAHVIFILATTDPQKIPPTILSRCQRFDFRRITARDICNAVNGFLESGELDTKIDDDALMYISVLADGSMRDALGILERCTAFYSEKPVTLDDVRDIIGTADNTVLFKLADALNSFDTGKCLKIISELVLAGRDIQQFVSDLLVHLRNLLVVGANSQSLDLSFENVEKLSAQAKEISRDVLIYLINIFSSLQNQLRYSANERIILETACIRFCCPIPEADQSEQQAVYDSYLKSLERRICELEGRLNSGEQISIKMKESGKEENNQEPKITVQINPAPPDIESGWKDFVKGVGMPLKAFLMKAKPVRDPNGRLLIIADEGCLTSLKHHEAAIRKKLRDKYGFNMNFEITDREPGGSKPNKFDNADFTEKINMDIMFEN